VVCRKSPVARKRKREREADPSGGANRRLRGFTVLVARYHDETFSVHFDSRPLRDKSQNQVQNIQVTCKRFRFIFQGMK